MKSARRKKTGSLSSSIEARTVHVHVLENQANNVMTAFLNAFILHPHAGLKRFVQLHALSLRAGCVIFGSRNLGAPSRYGSIHLGGVVFRIFCFIVRTGMTSSLFY